MTTVLERIYQPIGSAFGHRIRRRRRAEWSVRIRSGFVEQRTNYRLCVSSLQRPNQAPKFPPYYSCFPDDSPSHHHVPNSPRSRLREIFNKIDGKNIIHMFPFSHPRELGFDAPSRSAKVFSICSTERNVLRGFKESCSASLKTDFGRSGLPFQRPATRGV